MSKKKLTLDKDRLVRLQNNQLDAAAGGVAEGNGSTPITITVGLAKADAAGSCCSKSCSNAEVAEKA